MPEHAGEYLQASLPVTLVRDVRVDAERADAVGRLAVRDRPEDEVAHTVAGRLPEFEVDGAALGDGALDAFDRVTAVGGAAVERRRERPVDHVPPVDGEGRLEGRVDRPHRRPLGARLLAHLHLQGRVGQVLEQPREAGPLPGELLPERLRTGGVDLDQRRGRRQDVGRRLDQRPLGRAEGVARTGVGDGDDADRRPVHPHRRPEVGADRQPPVRRVRGGRSGVRQGVHPVVDRVPVERL
ncbi:hypothetical protein BRD18_06785 [Halobacteriales archaeon SW_7_71_33]|nr:MAG: hypothetical protein BRD18_06785 [Halobacteriales archaeon SW_7_71_33]